MLPLPEPPFEVLTPAQLNKANMMLVANPVARMVNSQFFLMNIP
jgi:hypothetical protein